MQNPWVPKQSSVQPPASRNCTSKSPIGIAKHFKIGDVLQDGAGLVSAVGNFFEGGPAFYDSAALRSAQEEVLREGKPRAVSFDVSAEAPSRESPQRPPEIPLPN